MPHGCGHPQPAAEGNLVVSPRPLRASRSPEAAARAQWLVPFVQPLARTQDLLENLARSRLLQGQPERAVAISNFVGILLVHLVSSKTSMDFALDPIHAPCRAYRNEDQTVSAPDAATRHCPINQPVDHLCHRATNPSLQGSLFQQSSAGTLPTAPSSFLPALPLRGARQGLRSA